LDDEDEVDNIFITNAKHYEYLNRVTRGERKTSTTQYKYKKGQIVETLLKKLMEPDSPTQKSSHIDKSF